MQMPTHHRRCSWTHKKQAYSVPQEVGNWDLRSLNILTIYYLPNLSFVTEYHKYDGKKLNLEQ